MNIEMNKKEIELLIKLLDEKLESIGILGDIGERFDYGVLQSKLNLLVQENKKVNKDI